MIKIFEKAKKIFTNGFFSKKSVKFIIKLLITIGVAFYLYQNTSLDEILRQIKNSNQFLLVITFFLGFINISLQYFKWKLTVVSVLEINDSKKILSSLLQGLAAAVSTPARLGEYVGRALPFSNKSFLQVTLATLVDKFFSLFIVIILGSLSSILYIHIFYDVFELVTISFLIIVLLFFYLVFLLLFNENFWDNFLFIKIKTSKRFSRYYQKFEVLKKLDKKYKSKMITLSFLFYLCVIIQYSFLVMAFSYDDKLIEYMWVGNLIMFTKTLIPAFTFGELGIRESASVYFIQRIGENPNVGFNASIFLFLINIIFPAIVGIIYQMRNNNE